MVSLGAESWKVIIKVARVAQTLPLRVFKTDPKFLYILFVGTKYDE